jgi:hypothetical protein
MTISQLPLVDSSHWYLTPSKGSVFIICVFAWWQFLEGLRT